MKAIAFIAVGVLGCSADVFVASDGGDPLTDSAALDALGPFDGGAGADGDASSNPDAIGVADTTTDTYDAPTSSGARHIFITSAGQSSNFGGLVGGDAICASVASGAGLGGHWAAWLSSSTVSAASRLEHAVVPYKLLNGITIASDWTQLVSGSLTNPITLDENSNVVAMDTPVWTGTDATGASESATCQDWTYDMSTTTVFGEYGWVGATNTDWTAVNGYWCDESFHLYCVEQP